MIETRALSKSFGAVAAVKAVDLTVEKGELRGIIGANGAGKSTLFGLIAGHLTPDDGRVLLRDQDITRLPPHRRAKLRLGIVFQSARLFRGMTALENVMVGAHAVMHAGFAEAMLRLPRHFREERLVRERARQALDRVGLADREMTPAESLPLGQQRLLQVARGLCGEPEVLLLDEPASGLRAHERGALGDLLAELKAEGLTMLLIEHDVAFVSRLADVVTVLDLGAVISEGSPSEVWRDQRVVAAYLGEETGVA